MRVAVIIPARNEAAAIGQVLAEIPRHLVQEIIVVDNGSTDGTAAAASRAGAGVVRVLRLGYGREVAEHDGKRVEGAPGTVVHLEGVALLSRHAIAARDVAEGAGEIGARPRRKHGEEVAPGHDVVEGR